MRLIYLLLTWLALPFVIATETWRARSNPDERGRVAQRLGYGAPFAQPGCLWVHAVSVGEVQAAAALVRALQARHPEAVIVLTTVTATGAQRARALFPQGVEHRYLPYDVPGAVRRFLDRLQPRLAIILETEIWPTLYRELDRRGVPVVLASARLSQRSVARFRRLSSLFAGVLAQDVTIGAQTEADAGRFRAVGAPAGRVQVTGNVKYDLSIPESTVAAGRAYRAACAAQRPVWIAGSTHEREEEAALEAHARLRESQPRALLILAPRHPQRFEAVRALLARRGVKFARRSAGEAPQAGDPVLLVDTLGELQMFYAAADVAFVGGSLVPVGGHSLLEPAVLGLPMLSGPYTQNAQDVADALRGCGALRIVADARALGDRLAEDLADPARARALGERGRATVDGSRGAVDRLVELIERRLSPPAASPRAPSSAG